MRYRFGRREDAVIIGFSGDRTQKFHQRLVGRARRKFFLGAAFGFLALLFESLHFLLTLEECGHWVSFSSGYKPSAARRLPGHYQRGSRGLRGASL